MIIVLYECIQRPSSFLLRTPYMLMSAKQKLMTSAVSQVVLNLL